MGFWLSLSPLGISPQSTGFNFEEVSNIPEEFYPNPVIIEPSDFDLPEVEWQSDDLDVNYGDILYRYDNAGNRTERTVFCEKRNSLKMKT